MSRILFSENQKFTQTWLIVVMIAANLSVVLPLGWGFYKQIIVGDTWGDQPLSDAGLITVLSVSLLIMAMVNVIIFGAKLEVEIKDNSVYYKYFPFVWNWKYVHKDNIENYKVRQFNALTEFGGYGYRKRFFKKLTALIIKGNRGLLLTFYDGRKLMIGTQQPEAIQKGYAEHNGERRRQLTMTKKKPFVLRLDPEILKAIEKWGADEFRSTNGQLEWIVHKALKDAGRLKKGKNKDDV